MRAARSFYSILLAGSSLLLAPVAAWSMTTGDFTFALYDSTSQKEVRKLEAYDTVQAVAGQIVQALPSVEVSSVTFKSSCLPSPITDKEAPYQMPLPAKPGSCDITVAGETSAATNTTSFNLVITIVDEHATSEQNASTTNVSRGTSTGAAPSATTSQSSPATPSASVTENTDNEENNEAPAIAPTPIPQSPAAKAPTPGGTKRTGLITDANGNTYYIPPTENSSSSAKRIAQVSADGAAISLADFVPEEDKLCAYPGNCSNTTDQSKTLSKGNTKSLVTSKPAAPDIVAMGRGSFTFTCQPSHFAYFNPFTSVDKQASGNLNLFFGNTHPETMVNYTENPPAGASTCSGGTANMSSYWVPALMNAEGEVQTPKTITVTYASGSAYIPFKTTQMMPNDMHLLTGIPLAKVAISQQEASFTCGKRTLSNIPLCTGGDLRMDVRFQQCWDGKNTQSVDFTHVTNANGGCPDTHPYAIPEISITLKYGIPATTEKWRLASDRYPLESKNLGGFSSFGGYVDGWDPAIKQAWHTNCINGGMRCMMSLGDGRGLSNP